jgi:hypothetical protein
MNLKLEALKAIMFLAIGGFLFVSFWPKPEPPKPVAIPESKEIAKLKKQLAEFSSKKRSIIKEYNCANGALSKETSVDEETAAKIAKEAELRSKKTEQLVVVPDPADNFKLGVNSKTQPGLEIMPIKHYWLGYKYDVPNKQSIYELSYSRHVKFLDLF